MAKKRPKNVVDDSWMNGVLKVVCLSDNKYRHQRFSVELPTVPRTPNTTQIVVDFYSHSYRASWYYQSAVYSPTETLVSCLKNNIKMYIKIYIKTAVLM